MATYSLLASSVLSVSATSVTFSSIPVGYTDLVIRSSVRHNGTGGNVWFMGAQFNTITGSVYSETFLVGDGSSVIGSGNTNDTPFNIHAGTINQNNYTANTFSNTEMYIPSYSAQSRQAWNAAFASENNATNYNYVGTNGGNVNTTESINQIILKPNGSVGGFAAGSSFYLYGVFNGPETLPSTPTIGTATAGNTSASVAFTPTSATGVDASYTALSSPGSLTATGTSSPITVSGLTNNTAYTFQVKANNPGGSSAYSAASNSVTPIDPAAWDSIATISATGSSLTFSSIPSTYRHLQIRYVAKTGSNAAAYIQFNGDTGSNYAFHYMRGNRVDISPFGYANQTTIGISPPDNGVGTTQPSTGVIDIIDYQSTTKNKTVKTFCGRDANITSGAEVAIISGLWRSTSAINSITITTFGTNFTSGTQFALYGIKGS